MHGKKESWPVAPTIYHCESASAMVSSPNWFTQRIHFRLSADSSQLNSWRKVCKPFRPKTWFMAGMAKCGPSDPEHMDPQRKKPPGRWPSATGPRGRPSPSHSNTSAFSHATVRSQEPETRPGAGNACFVAFWLSVERWRFSFLPVLVVISIGAS